METIKYVEVQSTTPHFSRQFSRCGISFPRDQWTPLRVVRYDEEGDIGEKVRAQLQAARSREAQEAIFNEAWKKRKESDRKEHIIDEEDLAILNAEPMLIVRNTDAVTDANFTTATADSAAASGGGNDVKELLARMRAMEERERKMQAEIIELRAREAAPGDKHEAAKASAAAKADEAKAKADAEAKAKAPAGGDSAKGAAPK